DILGSGKDLSGLPEYLSIIADSRRFTFERAVQPSRRLSKFSRRRLMEEIRWPQNSGTYGIGDVSSPVVVICPVQDKNIQEHAVNAGAAAAGPCLTPRGVELLITNTISNPNIRYIILAGRDSGHFTADLIENVSLNGVDASKKVIGTVCPSFPYLPNLPPDAIERFRRQVEVINLIGIFDPTLITLVVRLCLQPPENAHSLSYDRVQKSLMDYVETPKLSAHILFDSGRYEEEPLIVPFSILDMQSIPYEAYSTVGATIYSSTLSEAHKVSLDFLRRSGVWVRREGGVMSLETLSTTILLENLESGLYPKGYRPVESVKTDEQLRQFLKVYRFWNYLVPWSTVAYDPKQERFFPALAEDRDVCESYGSRVAAKGIEGCSEEERNEIVQLVKAFQEEHSDKIPSFHDLLEFYEELEAVQRDTFNQILAVSDACSMVISDELTGARRQYLQLQLSDDLRSVDPRKMHTPSFATFVPYFRKAYYKEYNQDGLMRRVLVASNSLSEKDGAVISGAGIGKKETLKYGWLFTPMAHFRSDDWFGFPASVHGAMALARFILWRVDRTAGRRVPLGFYSHHMSSFGLPDYALDKSVVENFSRFFPKIAP
ncbi:MAG: hypothetical protein JW727_05355, partial [Candidatus Aenigmarchaeota archaeon]|nr:hypothetical protein [Candidatus Aenigmarchaeota archaeon]